LEERVVSGHGTWGYFSTSHKQNVKVSDKKVQNGGGGGEDEK